MGVRFACHACGKRLNIKTELAGRRGICPACSVRFRIPADDSESSIPLDADDSGSSIGSPNAPSAVAERSGGIAVRTQTTHLTHTTTSARQNASTESHPVGSQASETNGRVATVASETASGTASASHEVTASGPTWQLILGGPTATWYVRPPSGGQYGPADGPTMGQWIQEGRVADLAMVWRDGWTDWQVAKEAIPGVDSPAVPADVSAPTAKLNNHATSSDPANTASTVQVTQRPAPLESNKKKRSQKRIAVSVILGLIFLALVVAFVFVLKS